MKNKKTLNSLGEFGFIETLKKDFSSKKTDKKILADIGDDCFCFNSSGVNICVTKDMLIEDTHFKTDFISPYELGKKAVEVNVSDIASMGCVKPKYIFVGLGCPGNIAADFIKKLYSGIKTACDEYKIYLAGGDTVKSEKLILSITVVGEGFGKIIKRSGASSGDFIGVTNTFGDSAAGLKLLLKYGTGYKYDKIQKYLISKHNLPKARLREASIIAEYASSMTDASDGLHIALSLLTGESKKGAKIHIEKIPVSKQLKLYEKDFLKCVKTALFGGEDFELVFTVSPSKAEKLQKLEPSISYIGQIDSSRNIKYFNKGKKEKLEYSGYKHFEK